VNPLYKTLTKFNNKELLIFHKQFYYYLNRTFLYADLLGKMDMIYIFNIHETIVVNIINGKTVGNMLDLTGHLLIGE
jgi:hypothetical protein